MIHLGRKPVSGGNPPRDNIMVRISVAISGVLFHVWDSDRVVVEEEKMNNVKVEIVIVMYTSRFSNIIVGS